MDGSGVTLLIVIGFFMFAVISGIAMLSCHYTLDGIKSKTVGDGQHGLYEMLHPDQQDN